MVPITDCEFPLWRIGNGHCDPDINNVWCDYDGGDCCYGNHHWIGDGYCDDMNNIVDCQFDGGDCCGPEIDTEYCAECICYE